MGLDSVELVQEWEKYFDVSIPDREAERINTVQNAVDCIGNLLNSKEPGQSKKKLFARLQQALLKARLTTRLVRENELATYCLPANAAEKWKLLEIELGLQVPMPEAIKNTTQVRSILFRKQEKASYDYSRITFDQLTDIIAAANYTKLTESKNIKNIYEVYAAVVGMTADKAGVELYEITKDSSFTTDLGID